MGSRFLLFSLCWSCLVSAFLLTTRTGSLRRLGGAAEGFDSIEAQAELRRLEDAAAANRDEFTALLKEKLEGWKAMKAAGILDGLASVEELTEEAVLEVDELSKRLLRRRRGKGEAQSFQLPLNDSRNAQSIHLLKEKLLIVGSPKTGSPAATLALLNEAKDKGIGDAAIHQGCLTALARLGTPSAVVSGFRTFLSLQMGGEKGDNEQRLLTKTKAGVSGSEIETAAKCVSGTTSENDASPTPTTEAFIISFVNSLLVSDLDDLRVAGSCILDMAHEAGYCVGANAVPEALPLTFLPALTCKAILDLTSAGIAINQKDKNKNGKGGAATPEVRVHTIKNASTQSLAQALAPFYTALAKGHFPSAAGPNLVLRTFGRRRLLPLAFDLLDRMRASTRVARPNDESFEFLVNALVASVEEEGAANRMVDLPSPRPRERAGSGWEPEVLLAGRSNVGKSSLVNFLLARKALASTSSTPGHTTKFHFYGVNVGRETVSLEKATDSSKVPSIPFATPLDVNKQTGLPVFRLVDIPGLGYAEASENNVDSWRSLLSRYLSVRDGLGLVLHLIDARHGVTLVDRALMEMLAEAGNRRRESGKSGFRYAVLLTKVDRAGAKGVLGGTKRAVEEALKETGLVESLESLTSSQVPVLETSVLRREGREGLWRLLMEVAMPEASVRLSNSSIDL